MFSQQQQRVDVDRCLCLCGAVRSALPPPSTGLTAWLSAREPASYLHLRWHRAKRSAKLSRAGANLLSLLTWSRGSSLRDSVSRIHGSGAQGSQAGKEGGGSLDRGFSIAHYSPSDPVNLRRVVQDTELRLHYRRSLTPAWFLLRIRLTGLLQDSTLS